MAIIQGVYAREILDSRGMPTVECTVWLDTGAVVQASVPSGTSKGKHEAIDLHDNDPQRYLGRGVLQAVNNVNTILGPQVIGKDPTQQTELDEIIQHADNTENKSKLGTNATTALSLAIAKAGASSLGIPLYRHLAQLYQLAETMSIPTCVYTFINGGEHGADNLDIQEFQVIPASFMDFPTSLNLAHTMFSKLEEVLITKGAIHSYGIVGGFTPNLYNNVDAFELLVETTKASPYTFAQDLFFGVDMGANSLFRDGKYQLKDKAQPYSTTEMMDLYRHLRTLYQVFFIEDPFHEDDWANWKQLMTELGPTTSIVGDTLLVSNLKRTQKAIAEKACNSICVKPNEAGTLSETIEVIRAAREAGWQIVMSHRSGETNDDFIADMAVGLGADYCKFGPPNRGERTAKYNRLMAIHQELSYQAQSS